MLYFCYHPVWVERSTGALYLTPEHVCDPTRHRSTLCDCLRTGFGLGSVVRVQSAQPVRRRTPLNLYVAHSLAHHVTNHALLPCLCIFAERPARGTVCVVAPLPLCTWPASWQHCPNPHVVPPLCSLLSMQSAQRVRRRTPLNLYVAYLPAIGVPPHCRRCVFVCMRVGVC
jgi:hypothetical protein